MPAITSVAIHRVGPTRSNLVSDTDVKRFHISFTKYMIDVGVCPLNHVLLKGMWQMPLDTITKPFYISSRTANTSFTVEGEIDNSDSTTKTGFVNYMTL